MEQDEATGSQAVFFEAQMKAIAGVVLQKVKKDEAAKTRAPTRHPGQASGSQESSAQGVCGRGCHVVIRARHRRSRHARFIAAGGRWETKECSQGAR